MSDSKKMFKDTESASGELLKKDNKMNNEKLEKANELAFQIQQLKEVLKHMESITEVRGIELKIQHNDESSIKIYNYLIGDVSYYKNAHLIDEYKKAIKRVVIKDVENIKRMIEEKEKEFAAL